MKKIVLPGATENLRKAGRWMIGNMQFNFPLSAIAAMNEMRNAAAMLMERPDIFRHTLKRCVKETLRKADTKKTLFLLYHDDAKAFDEFSDNIIDITEADVTKLRSLIHDGMEQAGVPDPELVAWVEAAHMLLHLAVQHYSAIVIRGNEKANADMLTRGQHIDYNRDFADFRMDGLLESWRRVAEIIDPAADVLTHDDVLGQLKYIASQYAKGTYINQCIDLMRHHPLFAKMEAEEDGDKIQL